MWIENEYEQSHKLYKLFKQAVLQFRDKFRICEIPDW